MPVGKICALDPSRGRGLIEPAGENSAIPIAVAPDDRAGLAVLKEGDWVAYEIQPDLWSEEIMAIDLIMLPREPA